MLGDIKKKPGMFSTVKKNRLLGKILKKSNTQARKVPVSRPDAQGLTYFAYL